VQHEGRRHDPAIDDVALEAFQQHELDRVAQTIVTSIAAVERIDSAALPEIDAQREGHGFHRQPGISPSHAAGQPRGRYHDRCVRPPFVTHCTT